MSQYSFIAKNSPQKKDETPQDLVILLNCIDVSYRWDSKLTRKVFVEDLKDGTQWGIKVCYYVIMKIKEEIARSLLFYWGHI